MGERNLDWLREHMRAHMSNANVGGSTDNILIFERPACAATNTDAAAQDLVYQTAELVEDVDNCAAERQARADALAVQVIEKLKIADDCVRSAESAKRTAEIKEFSDRVVKAFGAKVQKIETTLEQAVSRLAATEARLAAAEQRAKATKLRANGTKNALVRIETPIAMAVLIGFAAFFLVVLGSAP